MSTAESLSLSNLHRPDVRADPYPFYAQLRTEDPVHWDEALGFWVLTRYGDISAVYGDPRFSRAQGLRRGFERLPSQEQALAEPVYRSLGKTMFYADPPYHTHLRGLVSSAFTPAAVERMRPRIEKIVEELLDAVQPDGQMDAIRQFAHPLPILVISSMLGLPAEDRERFKAWSDDLFAILGSVPHSPDLMERAAGSQAQLADYLAELSRARRGQPEPDLLTALVEAVDSGERLTEEELVANATILLSAGHETTSHLLGNGLLALLRHPDQLELLQQQPTLISSAVEEMMRYDNPVQIAYRSATADVNIGGRFIRGGQLVNSVLAAGNRDPERFSDADRFYVRREEGRHLGFGLGIHFCIGAPLVRLEAQIAFTALLRRFPGLRLDAETLEWQEHPIFRGVKALPVAF
jgi:cytochrome P450